VIGRDDFEKWWESIGVTFAESESVVSTKELCSLFYQLGMLNGFDNHDKVTQQAIALAVIEFQGRVQ